MGVSTCSLLVPVSGEPIPCTILLKRLLLTGGGICGIPDVSTGGLSGISGNVPLGIPISSSSPNVNICFVKEVRTRNFL